LIILVLLKFLMISFFYAFITFLWDTLVTAYMYELSLDEEKKTTHSELIPTLTEENALEEDAIATDEEEASDDDETELEDLDDELLEDLDLEIKEVAKETLPAIADKITPLKFLGKSGRRVVGAEELPNPQLKLGMKRGGKVKHKPVAKHTEHKPKGGRGDGIATKGFTKGRYL
jgi:hypothetical protein